MPRLNSVDPLRARLNAISSIFADLDDSNFDEALPLRSNFRDIQRRLRRSNGPPVDHLVRSLDNTSEAMMDDLLREIMIFFGAMSAEKYWLIR